MDYSANVPNTFAKDISLVETAPIDLSNIDLQTASALSFGAEGGPPTGGGAGAASGWTFICAPEQISWTTANAVNRVDIFGTNNPPAISGTRGMRELNLNNALVEGFTRNKKVEAKVGALEDLLAYKSSLSGGYVNVPVYQVWANEKGYGKQAYFVMKSIQVKEMMRDLTGDATRAYVDVTFIEVPAFQVDSGLDQAPFSQLGSGSGLLAASAGTAAAQKQIAELQNQNAQLKAAAAPAKPKTTKTKPK